MPKRHLSECTSPLPEPVSTQDASALLAMLPNGIITITRDGIILYANMAAEHFLGASLSGLRGNELAQFIYPVSELLVLIETAITRKSLIREYDFIISSPRIGTRNVNLQVQPLENETEALLIIDDRGMADKLGQHSQHQANTRLTGNMSAILAHEIKNPLSGIRGAAQLLDKTVAPDDRLLTTLICSEVDRIRDVIDEIEIFSDHSSLKPAPVNIHEALQYVRMLSEKSFGAHVKFKEHYDPSLPLVSGHRNLLVQMFINLLKNASDALKHHDNPELTLSTAYQSGFRVISGDKNCALPILVSIEDNGPGIPQELHESIFDPFITTKAGGKGLGLAIVAKIVADHGGVIELDRNLPAGTRFSILLPAA